MEEPERGFSVAKRFYTRLQACIRCRMLLMFWFKTVCVDVSLTTDDFEEAVDICKNTAVLDEKQCKMNQKIKNYSLKKIEFLHFIS